MNRETHNGDALPQNCQRIRHTEADKTKCININKQLQIRTKDVNK